MNDEVAVILTGDSSGAVKAINSVMSSLEKLGSNTASVGGSMLSSLTSAMAAIASAIGSALSKVLDLANKARETAGALGLIGAAFEGMSVKSAAGLESSLARIQGLALNSKTAAQDIGTVKQQLLDMATQVPVPLNQLADAYYHVVSAGVQVKDAQVVETQVMKAASASHADATSTLNAMVGAMNAYGVNMHDSAETQREVIHTTDVMTKTVQLGNMTMGDLAGSIGRVLPMAHALGLSMESAAADIAVLTHAGLSADEAATQLSAVMSQMIQQPKQGVTELNRLGTSYNELLQIMRRTPAEAKSMGTELFGLSGAFSFLEDKINAGTTSAEEYGSSLHHIFPNVRALRDYLTSWKSQGIKMSDIFNGVLDSAGTVDKAFAVLQQTLKYWVAQLKNDFNVILTMFGGPLLLPLESAAKKINAIFLTIIETMKQHPDWVKEAGQVLALASAFGVMAGGVSALGGALAVVGTSFGGVFLGMRQMTDGLFAILEPLGLLGAGVMAFSQAWDNNWFHMRDTLESMGFKPILDDITGAFGQIGKAADEMIHGKFSEAWQTAEDALDGLRTKLIGADGVLLPFVEKAGTALEGLGKRMAGGLKDLGGDVLEAIGRAFEYVGQHGGELAQDLITRLQTSLRKGMTTHQADFNNFGHDFMEALGNALNTVGGGVGGVFSFVSRMLVAISGVLAQEAPKILSGAEAVLQTLLQYFDSHAQDIGRAIGTAVGKAGAYLGAGALALVAQLAFWVSTSGGPLLIEAGAKLAIGLIDGLVHGLDQAIPQILGPFKAISGAVEALVLTFGAAFLALKVGGELEGAFTALKAGLLSVSLGIQKVRDVAITLRTAYEDAATGTTAFERGMQNANAALATQAERTAAASEQMIILQGANAKAEAATAAYNLELAAEKALMSDENALIAENKAARAGEATVVANAARERALFNEASVATAIAEQEAAVKSAAFKDVIAQSTPSLSANEKALSALNVQIQQNALNQLKAAETMYQQEAAARSLDAQKAESIAADAQLEAENYRVAASMDAMDLKGANLARNLTETKVQMYGAAGGAAALETELAAVDAERAASGVEQVGVSLAGMGAAAKSAITSLAASIGTMNLVVGAIALIGGALYVANEKWGIFDTEAQIHARNIKKAVSDLAQEFKSDSVDMVAATKSRMDGITKAYEDATAKLKALQDAAAAATKKSAGIPVDGGSPFDAAKLHEQVNTAVSDMGVLVKGLKDVGATDAQILTAMGSDWDVFTAKQKDDIAKQAGASNAAAFERIAKAEQVAAAEKAANDKITASNRDAAASTKESLDSNKAALTDLITNAAQVKEKLGVTGETIKAIFGPEISSGLHAFAEDYGHLQQELSQAKLTAGSESLVKSLQKDLQDGQKDIGNFVTKLMEMGQTGQQIKDTFKDVLKGMDPASAMQFATSVDKAIEAATKQRDVKIKLNAEIGINTNGTEVDTELALGEIRTKLDAISHAADDAKQHIIDAFSDKTKDNIDSETQALDRLTKAHLQQLLAALPRSEAAGKLAKEYETQIGVIDKRIATEKAGTAARVDAAKAVADLGAAEVKSALDSGKLVDAQAIVNDVIARANEAYPESADKLGQMNDELLKVVSTARDTQVLNTMAQNFGKSGDAYKAFIEKVEKGEEPTRAANEVYAKFGKGFQDYLPYLSNYTDELVRTGVITPETAAKIDGFTTAAKNNTLAVVESADGVKYFKDQTGLVTGQVDLAGQKFDDSGHRIKSHGEIVKEVTDNYKDMPKGFRNAEIAQGDFNTSLQGSGKNTKEISDSIIKSIADTNEPLAKWVKDLHKSGEDGGKALGEGAKTGLDTAIKAITTAIDAWHDLIVSSMGNAFEYHSPSQIGVRAGESIGEGAAQGINNGIIRVTLAIAAMGMAAIGAMATVGTALYNTAFNAGFNASAGLAAGIGANLQAAQTAANALADAATTAVQARLQMQSPSKVFHKIGQNVVEGFVNGFNSGSDSVFAAVKGLVQQSIIDPFATLKDQVRAGMDAVQQAFADLPTTIETVRAGVQAGMQAWADYTAQTDTASPSIETLVGNLEAAQATLASLKADSDGAALTAAFKAWQDAVTQYGEASQQAHDAYIKYQTDMAQASVTAAQKALDAWVTAENAISAGLTEIYSGQMALWHQTTTLNDLMAVSSIGSHREINAQTLADDQDTAETARQNAITAQQKVIADQAQLNADETERRRQVAAGENTAEIDAKIARDKAILGNDQLFASAEIDIYHTAHQAFMNDAAEALTTYTALYAGQMALYNDGQKAAHLSSLGQIEDRGHITQATVDADRAELASQTATAQRALAVTTGTQTELNAAVAKLGQDRTDNAGQDLLDQDQRTVNSLTARLAAEQQYSDASISIADKTSARLISDLKAVAAEALRLSMQPIDLKIKVDNAIAGFQRAIAEGTAADPFFMNTPQGQADAAAIQQAPALYARQQQDQDTITGLTAMLSSGTIQKGSEQWNNMIVSLGLATEDLNTTSQAIQQLGHAASAAAKKIPEGRDATVANLIAGGMSKADAEATANNSNIPTKAGSAGGAAASQGAVDDPFSPAAIAASMKAAAAYNTLLGQQQMDHVAKMQAAYDKQQTAAKDAAKAIEEAMKKAAEESQKAADALAASEKQLIDKLRSQFSGMGADYLFSGKGIAELENNIKGMAAAAGRSVDEELAYLAAKKKEEEASSKVAEAAVKAATSLTTVTAALTPWNGLGNLGQGIFDQQQMALQYMIDLANPQQTQHSGTDAGRPLGRDSSGYGTTNTHTVNVNVTVQGGIITAADAENIAQVIAPAIRQNMYSTAGAGSF